ncbi:IucA/IucC family protein [Paenibacillus sp. 481]|uniref:IucA/IucC family protein n=1 Tax=Paenibacillus sp. 481 TaxID=2835869 RepID=UPI001E4F9BAA|nr:IucA/IucC family protein [Paenibacillus sp. 481]UHA72683.1 IucA/IucC family siderophore biosynthesis protein [Paenibacillus sp. 481]
MLDTTQLSAHMSQQSFLNCYLRETGQGEWISPAKLDKRFPVQSRIGSYVNIHLPLQGITLCAAVKYKSATGRHLFEFPICYVSGPTGGWVHADVITLTAFLMKELAITNDVGTIPDELMLRIIESYHNIDGFVEGRSDDTESLYGFDADFIQAEQSLLFGHLNHPTPKSRQGIPEQVKHIYSPELKGQFALHYFRAHRSIVEEDSALADSATEIVKAELRADSEVDPTFVAQYCQADSYSLIPVHPLEVQRLLADPNVQQWLDSGLIQYLGAQGKRFMATSSLRTVYHPESQFMFKFSLHVKVTNSLRVNKFNELELGLEIKRLLDNGVGEVSNQFPAFEMINDPAFITLKMVGQEESGFEVVLRENPFQGEKARNATLVAGLVQDSIPGHRTRLSTIIHRLAEEEGRSVQQVSVDWFRRYLHISLKPMVWMYLTYGIALEAHQQNSVVQLEAGYPNHFYFRDNQGYYYCTSMKEKLDQLLPGVGENSQMLYDDAIVDERFTYYLIFNHMYGLINGFGSAGLIQEEVLLHELRSALEQFVPMNREPSRFLHNLLTQKQLPCKANLLTRFYDMDELVDSLDLQSVYVNIDNPLALVIGLQNETGVGPAGASNSAENSAEAKAAFAQTIV